MHEYERGSAQACICLQADRTVPLFMRDIGRFDIAPCLRYFYRRRDIMQKEAAMSVISLLLELSRNRMVSIDEPRLAQGPGVPMCDREANVASMDEGSFGRTMSIVESGQRREMVIHQGLARGCADLYEGRTSDARNVLDSIRAKNGWSCRLQS